jgi:hypothetical protein
MSFYLKDNASHKNSLFYVKQCYFVFNNYVVNKEKLLYCQNNKKLHELEKKIKKKTFSFHNFIGCLFLLSYN